ncbi:MAG: superoxide dismutase family protein [Chloroflexi bacterium]|nr:superoxide dismutase family protein [Chloroflexota bacterium]
MACTTQPTPTPAVAKPTTPAVTGAATTPTTRPPPSPSPIVVAQRAFTELRNAQSTIVGVATFNQAAPTRLEIDVTVTNVEPGRHGLPSHEVGRCEPPGFTTAGEHLNPTTRQHGLENPQGPHAGAELRALKPRKDPTVLCLARIDPPHGLSRSPEPRLTVVHWEWWTGAKYPGPLRPDPCPRPRRLARPPAHPGAHQR